MAASLTFRPAKIEEANQIARLYSLSTDGVSDYIWFKQSGLPSVSQLKGGVITLGEKHCREETTRFSYKHCTVVVSKKGIVGMLGACDANNAIKEMNLNASDRVLTTFYRLLEEDSYFVMAVAVTPGHQGTGIGNQLLRLSERHGMARGYKKISIIVFEKDEYTKGLYERAGFREAKRASIHGHPLIRHQGEAILMIKDI